MTLALSTLVAVDIGNSRIKLGLFGAGDGDGLPEPISALELNARDWSPATIGQWLAKHSAERATWRIGSVFRGALVRLNEWIAAERPDDEVHQLAAADLPLRVMVAAPERVGIDRLLGAVAANRLRQPHRAAVVVDLGSAITVDLVLPDGAFSGGAILPGIAMSARALHEQTDLLPEVPLAQLGDPLPALGTSTAGAIEAGLYWGAVGGVRELAAQLAEGQQQVPHLFLTGGAAPSVARLLGGEAHFVPHLVLAGIALCHRAPGP